MRQFTDGTDAQYEHLGTRAARACVRFRDRLMPPGVTPTRAAIGFERHPDGSAVLLVQDGLEYRGSNPDVRDWLALGVKRFTSWEALRDWIRRDLRCVYREGEGSVHRSEAAGPMGLTDLGAVREPLPRHSLLDEDALFVPLVRAVRGQDHVLRMLSRRVARHAARCTPRRPLTVLALGPTGVGKTKTADQLPQVLRRLDPRHGGLVRLDMNLFTERHRVSELLGAPPGYVGYGEGARLATPLEDNPRSVVLFDEIEKAHPDMWQILMNAMDTGRLAVPRAGSSRHVIRCEEAVFFFTANLDSRAILDELEEQDGWEKPRVIEAVCRRRLTQVGLRPELVGRIACFLPFRPLSAEARAEIAALAIVAVAAEYGLTVSRVEPPVIWQVLAEDPVGDFGARPLEYAIDEILGEVFARTAAAGGAGSVAVLGPPLRCVSLCQTNAP